jgi:hypothetical protein
LQQILLRCPVQATRQVSWKHCLFVWGLMTQGQNKNMWVSGFPTLPSFWTSKSRP